MLIKLHLQEIVNQTPLAFDILDRQGQVLYTAGSNVSNKELKRKVHEGFFRQQERLPLEWLIRDECPGIQTTQLEEIREAEDSLDEVEKLSLPYLLKREKALPYLNSMFRFWKDIENHQALDIALLKVIDENLVSSIVSRMDQLQYLTQLKIRDGVTYSHTLDVTTVSIALGVKLGLDTADLNTLALGALLHDLGKLFIPRSIMFKPTRLTDQEFEVMQLHPSIGYRIIREELKLPEEVARPALEHQELYAGGGYPQNLAREDIHFFSQIVKIADVYDALTSKRPYKEAISSYKAIRIMLLEGRQSFNPMMLRHLLELANYPDEIPLELMD